MAKSGVVSAASSLGASTQPTGGADPVLQEQLSILRITYLRGPVLIFGMDTEEGEYSARDVLLSMGCRKVL